MYLKLQNFKVMAIYQMILVRLVVGLMINSQRYVYELAPREILFNRRCLLLQCIDYNSVV